MTEVRFDGVLDFAGDDCVCTSPTIGGRRVIDELDEAFGAVYSFATGLTVQRVVKVTLGVEPLAEGVLETATGFGGTDVTPTELPEIKVGGVDVLDHLDDLDGREVILIVESA